MSVINRNSGSAIFDTFAIALTKNMRVGQVCIVNGQVTSSDGLGAQYEVKANGSGGVQMSNGNELVILDGETLKPESVANIAGLTGTKDNSQALLKGWHPDSDVGGGTLYWDSSALKSTHNGGTIFSDTVPWTTTTADYLNGVGETDPGGAGVWVRVDAVSVFDVLWFGAVGDGAINDTASIQSVYDFISSSSLNATVYAPSGKYAHTGITTKPGCFLLGDGKQTNKGTEFFLIAGSNTDSFKTQTATFTQFEGFQNLAINGNKTNQTGTSHGINAYWWDIANHIFDISILDHTGAGLYFDNTGTQPGEVMVRDLICNRNDLGGVKVFGPFQHLNLINTACEGNGLDGTGGSSGANYVFEDMNDTTQIHMWNCRGEARDLSIGGGVRHIDLIDNSNASIFITGGYWSTGNLWAEHVRVTTSGSRVYFHDMLWQTTTTTIIDDQFLGYTVDFSNSNADSNIRWDQINKKQREYIHNGVDATNNLIASVSDSGGASTIRDIGMVYNVDDGTQIKVCVGAGTPEGNIVANIGSTFHRIDGGAGTSFYVKESGTGNTGWIGK